MTDDWKRNSVEALSLNPETLKLRDRILYEAVAHKLNNVINEQEPNKAHTINRNSTDVSSWKYRNLLTIFR